MEKFYRLVGNIVDIIFEKKNTQDVSDTFSSNNKIPRKIRVLMRNKRNISKSIINSKSGYKIANLRTKLHQIEDKLQIFYQDRRQNKESDAIKKIRNNPKFSTHMQRN